MFACIGLNVCYNVDWIDCFWVGGLWHLLEYHAFSFVEGLGLCSLCLWVGSVGLQDVMGNSCLGLYCKMCNCGTVVVLCD